MHTLPSSFLFHIIIYHCKIYQLKANNVPKKGKNKSKNRPGKARKGPHLKNVFQIQLCQIGLSFLDVLRVSVSSLSAQAAKVWSSGKSGYLWSEKNTSYFQILFSLLGYKVEGKELRQADQKLSGVGVLGLK